MTAPTVVQQTATAFDTTTPKTATLASATAGDLIVVMCMTDDNSTEVGTPTGTNLTFVQQFAIGPTGYCEVRCFTAPVTVTGSVTVSIPRAYGTNYGADVLLVRNHGGVGAQATATVASTAPALSITTTGANSLLVYGFADWTAVSGASRTWRTTAGATTDDAYSLVSGAATFYAGRTNDAGAIGAKVVGLTAPTGQKSTQGAIEVKGTAGTANNYTSSPADAEGLTDSVARTISATRTQGDPLGLTDSVTKTVGYVRTINDSLGMTDAVAQSLGGQLNNFPSDSAGLTDSVTTAINYIRQIDDAMGITDTDQPIVVDISWLIEDPENLTDSVIQVLGIIRQPADTLGMTDSVSAVLTSPAANTLNDPLGITDTVSWVMTQVRTISDSITLSDSVALRTDDASVFDDALGMTDSVSAVLDRVVIIADSMGLSDAVLASDGIRTTILGVWDGTQVVNVELIGVQLTTLTPVEALGIWDGNTLR